MRLIFSIAILLFIVACTPSGPDPTDKNYQAAIVRIPEAETAAYITAASWYPGSTLDNFFSFDATNTPGHLFVTQKELIFAIFEGGQYLNTKKISYASIDWMTHKPHGVSRIVTFKTADQVDSFVINHAVNGGGTSANIDDVVSFIASRVK